MDAVELRAVPRSVTGKQVKALRRQGMTPGVIYGYGIEPLAVQFGHRDIEKAFGRVGTSTTVQVVVEGREEPILAIFRAVQHHAIKRNLVHVDLQALNAEETVRVPVAVILVGMSAAVETFGGILLQVMNELEIEALPTALVPHIEVDISSIVQIGQSISVGDITPPPGVTILNHASEVIVQVTKQEEEEIEEAKPGSEAEVAATPAAEPAAS